MSHSLANTETPVRFLAPEELVLPSQVVGYNPLSERRRTIYLGIYGTVTDHHLECVLLYTYR